MVPAGKMRKEASPYLYAVWGSEVERLTRLHVEGGVPGVKVADGIGAELPGRVRVGKNLLAEGALALLAGVVLGEGEEELLVAA